jgi:hypothetical protein
MIFWEGTMTPTEFFETVEQGAHIRYGKDGNISVRVDVVHRECKLVYGRECGTGRRVMLYLSNGMLKEGDRACDCEVERVS